MHHFTSDNVYCGFLKRLCRNKSREDDIANVLEHWAEQVRMLANFGTAHKLPAAYKITALSQIMKNKKDKFDDFEDQARMQHPNDEEAQFESFFIISLKPWNLQRAVDSKSTMLVSKVISWIATE